MAIDSYSNLKTAVSNWLDRSDLTDRIPEFISLAEDRINRHLRIRSQEQRQQMSTVSGQEYYGLPTDYLQMRHIAIMSTPNRDLEYLTPERFEIEIGTRWSGGTGRPRFYTMVGDELRLGPKPGGVYTVEMLFYKKFPHLSESNSSNRLLEDNADLLLYGALLEANPFIKDPESAKMWGLYFNQSLDAIMTSDAKDRHSGGALTIRADSVGI